MSTINQTIDYILDFLENGIRWRSGPMARIIIGISSLLLSAICFIKPLWEFLSKFFFSEFSEVLVQAPFRVYLAWFCLYAGIVIIVSSFKEFKNMVYTYRSGDFQG